MAMKLDIDIDTATEMRLMLWARETGCPEETIAETLISDAMRKLYRGRKDDPAALEDPTEMTQ